VASRRLTDQLRADQARRRREEAEWRLVPRDQQTVEQDDSLVLLFLCCHPVLAPASQISLTLRAVGGLTTEEIARALLVPTATMAKRITRAKKSVDGLGFTLPTDQAERLTAVQQVLYLIFNEGYTNAGSPLADEAIRLTRQLHQRVRDDAEVAGLLALMLLTHARRAARTNAAGNLMPMAEQDRTLWDHALIAEGAALVESALPRTPRFGPYLLQAAIAAVHSEATRAEDTDWPEIVALYRLLLGISDNPVVTLNYAVAVAMVDGPAAGLALLEPLDADNRMTEQHRLAAVRAHLLEMSGDVAAAREHYLDAARRTTSLPEQAYLQAKAAALD
jgi:predicted RNA polymerase sigma factor